MLNRLSPCFFVYDICSWVHDATGVILNHSVIRVWWATIIIALHSFFLKMIMGWTFFIVICYIKTATSTDETCFLSIHWGLNLITDFIALNGLRFYPNRIGVSTFSYYKTFIRSTINSLVLFLVPLSRYKLVLPVSRYSSLVMTLFLMRDLLSPCFLYQFLMCFSRMCYFLIPCFLNQLLMGLSRMINSLSPSFLVDYSFSLFVMMNSFIPCFLN